MNNALCLPQAQVLTMSMSTPDFDNSHYEDACDQAIAMCDGNLRGAIKALIMANEFLETELLELQAAIACGCAQLSQQRSGDSGAASR